MVVQRVTARLMLVAMISCVALSPACVRARTARLVQPIGSCDGACAHYMRCKHSSDDIIYRACVRECVETFAVDGVQDAETLGQIELLDCQETVGFVEGSGGRPPGAAL